MGLGFVIERFGLAVDMPGSKQARVSQRDLSFSIGTAFIAPGIAAAIRPFRAALRGCVEPDFRTLTGPHHAPEIGVSGSGHHPLPFLTALADSLAATRLHPRACRWPESVRRGEIIIHENCRFLFPVRD